MGKVVCVYVRKEKEKMLSKLMQIYIFHNDFRTPPSTDANAQCFKQLYLEKASPILINCDIIAKGLVKADLFCSQRRNKNPAKNASVSHCDSCTSC